MIRTTFEKLLVPALVLATWQYFGQNGVAPPYLSYPTQIASALWRVARDGELSVATAVSLYRVAAGFAIGCAAGMAAGLSAGMVKPLRNFFDPLAAFLFPVPKIAFLPIFLLLFGIGDMSKIAIVAFSCFFPMFVSARQSVLTVNRNLIWAGRNMGASSPRLFLRVLLPAAAPQLFNGVRISLANAFVVLFAAELIGAHAGLGELISQGEDAARFDLMLAAIFVFGVLGFTGDRLVMAARKRILKGQSLETEERAAS